MRKTFFIILFLGLGYSQSIAQAPATFDANQVSALVNPGGDLFWDLIGDPMFEVPKNSGKHTLFAGNLWIGALDTGGQLRLAAQTYRQTGSDLFYGPVASNYNAAYVQRYDRVWKIEQSEIDFHIAHWTDPGYTPVASIADWPGNGDTSNGETAKLAPYFNNDANPDYDPLAGDYPLIRGDQAVFFLMNDIRTFHSETFGEPLGLEFYCMAYGYKNSLSPAVDHTLYMHYTIFNKGNLDLTNMYIGNWVDFDIGFSIDDYVGCDSSLHTMYAYNGDNNDNGANGYGLNPPAQGFTFLNQDMSGFIYYQNDFSPQGNPTTAAEYYRYLTALYKNGTPVLDPNNQPTKYMFSGDPVTQTGWVEANNSPSDRKGLGVTGPFDLKPGASICMDGAYVFGRDSLNGDRLASITTMKDRIQVIRDLYDLNNYDCANETTTPLDPLKSKFSFQAYPIPATDVLVVEMGEGYTDLHIELCDLTGKKAIPALKTSAMSTKLDVSSLAQGMYILTLTDPEGALLGQQKIIKE